MNSSFNVAIVTTDLADNGTFSSSVNGIQGVKLYVLKHRSQLKTI